ncbi:MAG: DUF2339 domain-containing protein [Bacteroidota bacterium]
MEILVFLILVLVIVVLVQLSSIKSSLRDIKKKLNEDALKSKSVVISEPLPLPQPKLPTPAPLPPPPPVPQPVPQPPPQPKKPSFFERNPDLEKFIGENLANKIGIGILVIGIGFFVKYAIDQEWINEIGRVFIGVLCGGILLGVAHYLRKKFTAFSSVLVGGGIAVLYLTIYIAYHSYGMFSPPIAFLLMVVITGFAVAFSLAYNKVELAVVALLGGFASPLMVATGEGNYVALFIYITILDVGMMVLSFYKKWPIINIISYVFTVILFGGWMSAQFDYEKPGMILGALVFATGFYFVFFAMNLLNNLKERRPFGGLDFALLLSNTFFYYAAGMFILDNETAINLRGLFTILLAVFNFGFAFGLFKSQRVDKNLVFLLIGLVLTFVSLAAPIQLKGNYITLFWAAETALLLWLSQKSGIKLMKLASYGVMALMIISLIMDLQQVYERDSELPIAIIFNKGYLTSLFSVASLVITLLLLKKEKSEDQLIDPRIYQIIITVALVLLVYVMNLLELRHHITVAYPDDTQMRVLTVGAYNMLFLLVLTLCDTKLASRDDARKAFAFIGVLAVLMYLGVYQEAMVVARFKMIMEGGAATAFGIHYAIVALIIPVCALSISRIKKLKEFNIRTANAYSWFFVAFFVFLASTELDNVVLLIGGTADNMEHVMSQNHKIGFPILWGLTSFVLIAIGLKMKLRHLRIISLTLFLVTLVKLFTVDIRGISEGGKIAAFISLGILLLIVSFMYQRLKKILLTDDSTPAK